MQPEGEHNAIQEATFERSRDILRDILATHGAEFVDPFQKFVALYEDPNFHVNISEIKGEATADFHLHVSAGEEIGFTIMPAFAIDSVGGLMGSTDEMVSELSRTIFIAAQYPTNGFERSMELVYLQALGLQAKLLDAKGIGFVKNDPRKESPYSLYEKLASKPRYYFDPSFDMYQEAWRWEAQGSDMSEEMREMVEDKAFFVKARELILATIFDPTQPSAYEDGLRKNHSRNAAEAIAHQALVLKKTGLLR